MVAFHARLSGTRLPGPLLCQGERPKAHLLEEFRNSGDAALVATMGFGEGVDVPGRALRLVILDKLPFPSPGDPVFSARMRMVEARGQSSFHELSVPEAAIALKQGFCRLVRTADDAGVVASLDRRMRTRPHGARLLRGLPPAAHLRELDEVRTFLHLHFGSGEEG